MEKQEIKHPESSTYFIAKRGAEVIAYGVVNPNQHMTTLCDTLDLFNDATLWETELNNLGVIIEN